MKEILTILTVSILLAMPLFAQINSESFHAFDAKGNALGIERIVDALKNADVVFLGEQHDDPTAHTLQAEIFKLAFEKYGRQRTVVLSMEMFERDSQIVVDEYLLDLINESNFISQSRAWGNYKTDYRPLVEFAKANKLSVVAANAPRRYVNRVSRLGRESLNVLSQQAKQWLAPLPYAAASEAYKQKFAAIMGGTQTHSPNLLDSQSLWDATMADSIAKAFTHHKKALVIHLNGGFHSENRLGAVEHLLKYRPKSRIIVVTMKSVEHFPNFDKAKDENAGDFVILTDPKLPRSKR